MSEIHETLLRRAMEAIDQVANDASVERWQASNSLVQLHDRIDEALELFDEDLDLDEEDEA